MKTSSHFIKREMKSFRDEPNKSHIELQPGMNFNNWTVLFYTGRHRNGRKTWMCRCICGKEKSVIEGNLKAGVSKSCGCRGTIKLIERNKQPRKNATNIQTAVTKQIIAGYKKDARKRNYTWALTAEECVALFSDKCFYCGEAYQNTRTTIGKRKDIVFKYNGIDRVDNTKGYTIDNVVTCCMKCNRAKDTMSQEEFKNHICKIYENLYGGRGH